MFLYEELERIRRGEGFWEEQKGEGGAFSQENLSREDFSREDFSEGNPTWENMLSGSPFGERMEYKRLPGYIRENLNPRFELRPYQVAAFENFITYYEARAGRGEPIQTLFHMATGSGKTLIMAGLMIYLYKQGYRNFLFFVNLANIVQKTKTNFLNAASGKYLFAQRIFLDGAQIRIREVPNFQVVEEDAINICFTTTQGLHCDMRLRKENHMSLDDFDHRQVVLISDEAHHLNATTKRRNQEEEQSYQSWEDTVKYIFEGCPSNLLLEFTATCDLENPLIKASYERKIVYDYPLKKFRQDLFSKEIVTLRSDLDRMDRALQALVLSQYRLKIFQRHGIFVKPVVLFKASKISDSRGFMKEFEERLRNLTGEELEQLSLSIDNPTMKKAYGFFRGEGITPAMLSQELRMEFSPEHCVSVNEEKDLEEKQLLLNSLEEKDNPYRAIFEVRKLDEGWDVLNLFDIVRLYETRQSGGRGISSTTISEAQLIGRGARYCPFVVHPSQSRDQRKYDQDLTNELRICEELYYHCQNDSRYIGELHQALREMGIDTKSTLTRENRLKPDFTQTDLYREGVVYQNQQRRRAPEEGARELLSQVRGSVHRLRLATGLSGEDVLMEEGEEKEEKAPGKSGEEPGQEEQDFVLSRKARENTKSASEPSRQVETIFLEEGRLYERELTLGEVAELSYAIPYKALARYPAYRFASLKRRLPGLSSLREFITGEEYLGGIRLILQSRFPEPPLWAWARAVDEVLKRYQGYFGARPAYEGSLEFYPVPLRRVFTDKICSYPLAGSSQDQLGIPQSDPSLSAELCMSLEEEPWYVYEENYGGLGEKAFVAYFKTQVEELLGAYDQVYLVRNERQLQLYSLVEGKPFAPAFVIFLRRGEREKQEQKQGEQMGGKRKEGETERERKEGESKREGVGPEKKREGVEAENLQVFVEVCGAFGEELPWKQSLLELLEGGGLPALGAEQGLGVRLMGLRFSKEGVGACPLLYGQ